MARYTYNNYSLFKTPFGDRYQHEGKIVSPASVPQDVKDNLNLLAMAGQEVPVIDESQKAELVAESVQVKPELKKEVTNEQEGIREQKKEIPEPPVESAPEQTQENVPTPEEAPAGQAGSPETVGSQDPVEPAPELQEGYSIYDAPLDLLARALFERFGVYTVHLMQPPTETDISPLTGERFTRYHLGLAYQAFNKVQAQGIPMYEIEEIQAKLDPVPQNTAQHAKVNSFDARTSLRPQIEGSGMQTRQVEDDLIPEPQLGRQVIRPDW